MFGHYLPTLVPRTIGSPFQEGARIYEGDFAVGKEKIKLRHGRKDFQVRRWLWTGHLAFVQRPRSLDVKDSSLLKVRRPATPIPTLTRLTLTPCPIWPPVGRRGQGGSSSGVSMPHIRNSMHHGRHHGLRLEVELYGPMEHGASYTYSGFMVVLSTNVGSDALCRCLVRALCICMGCRALP